MTQLRKPTEILRVVIQEAPACVIVGPEVGAPAGAVRKVALLVQSEPTLYVAVDTPVASSADRDAYWPQLPAAQRITFHLLAHQTLVGRAENELHELTVIVEYI